MRRSTLEATLDVTTSVDLETFESPEFFDDLQRVQTNSLTQPLTLSQGLITTFGGIMGVAGLTVALILIEPLLVPMLLVSALPLWLVSRATGRIEFDFNYAQTPGHRLRFYLVATLLGRLEAKEVRAFGLGPPLLRRWHDSYATYIDDLRASRPPPPDARARRHARDGDRDHRRVRAADLVRARRPDQPGRGGSLR